MSLIEHTLFGKRDMVATAIERIRTFAPKDGTPYWLAFSGGKDSCVCERLLAMSGMPYEKHYAVTTVDPPELVRFIQHAHPDTIWHRPEHSMWRLIDTVKLFPPLRQQRYCCERLKETVVPSEGCLCVTGVRWEESARRANRKMYEPNKRINAFYLHPIIDWTEAQVWEFIRVHNVPYCSLYDEGKRRLGCVLCPQQGQRRMREDAQRWPKIAAAYVRAFDRALAKRKAQGRRADWATGQEWFDWWVGQNQDDGEDCALPLFDN